MNFDQAFDALIGNEGGYVNNSMDPGGATNWGITARVAVANGYIGDMRYLSKDTAKTIYKKLYWDAVRGDELPPALVFHVFDAASTQGLRRPSSAAAGGRHRARWGVGRDHHGGGAKGGRARAGGDVQRRAPGFHDQPANLGRIRQGWTRRIAGNLKLLGAA